MGDLDPIYLANKRTLVTNKGKKGEATFVVCPGAMSYSRTLQM